MYEMYSAEDAAPLGDIPGLPNIDATETVGSLKYVRSDVRDGAVQIIGTMSQLSIDQGGIVNVGDGLVNKGTAHFMFAMPSPTNWVTSNVATGNAILVRPAGGAIDVIQTSSPSTILKEANALTGTYAVLAGPPALLTTANTAVVPPFVPGDIPSPWTPSTTDPYSPLPGLPGLPGMPPVPAPYPAQPAPEPVKTGLPGWVLPVAVVGGGALLVGVVVLSRKKKMVANKRRRHRRRR